MQKIKERQTSYFPKTTDSVAIKAAISHTLIPSTGGPDSSVVCSVTREPIGDHTTYLLLTQAHLTNLRKSQTALMMQHGKLAKDLRLSQLASTIRKSSDYGGHLVLTHCGHSISATVTFRPGDTTKNFTNAEYECPMCKKPANVLLPIYCKQIWEALHTSSKPKSSEITGLTGLADFLVGYSPSSTPPISKIEDLLDLEQPRSHLDPLHDKTRSETPNRLSSPQKAPNHPLHTMPYPTSTTLLLSQQSTLVESFTAQITSFLDYYTGMHEEVWPQHAQDIRGSKSLHADELLADALCEGLHLPEHRKLASCFESAGLVGHNLYLTLRTKVLLNAADSSITKEGRNTVSGEYLLPSDRVNAAVRTLRIGFGLITSVCQSLLQDSTQETEEGALQLDLPSIWCRLATILSTLPLSEPQLLSLQHEVTRYFLVLKYTQALRREGFAGSTRWENIRYHTKTPKASRVTQAVKEFLRKAALMKCLSAYILFECEGSELYMSPCSAYGNTAKFAADFEALSLFGPSPCGATAYDLDLIPIIDPNEIPSCPGSGTMAGSCTCGRRNPRER